MFIYIGAQRHLAPAFSGCSTPKAKFEAGLKEVIGKITAGGARVILCTPTVADRRDRTNKHDAMLEEYAP